MPCGSWAEGESEASTWSRLSLSTATGRRPARGARSPRSPRPLKSPRISIRNGVSASGTPGIGCVPALTSMPTDTFGMRSDIRPRSVITPATAPHGRGSDALPRNVCYAGEAREIAGLEDRRRAGHIEFKVDGEWLAVGQLHRILARADDPFEGLTGAGGSPPFCLFEETEYGPQPIVFRERNGRTTEFHRGLRTVRTASLPGELLGRGGAARVADALPA